MLLVSCEKEEASDGRIEIFAESMSGGSKVLLDGANATWVDGDSIRINGDKVVVERQGEHAYISYATPQSVNRAVYPTNLVSTTLTSDNITVNFPAYYHYRVDATTGRQILELPMAARSEGSDPLQFKHLTGALYVTVKNTAAVPLTLQSVTVSSNRYRLNGTRSVNLSDLEDFGSATAGTVDERIVTLLFDTGYTLATDESVRVMVPVMPVGGSGDNLFTIKVRSFSAGQANFYLYSRQQTSGSDHTLARNELGYAPVSITASGTTNPLDLVTGEYIVRTPIDFKIMVDDIQNQTRSNVSNSANYKITEHIDMTGLSMSTITNTTFTGTIDGDHHKVKNLTINSVVSGGSCYCSFFKNVPANNRITNISFDRLILNAHNTGNTTLFIAGIIAENETGNKVTLSNCTVNILSVNDGGATGSVYFGGLLGYASSELAISDCKVTTLGSVSIGGNSLWFGGLIGYKSNSKTTITNFSWSGSVRIDATSQMRVGGMIGQKISNRFTATDCSVSGTIDAYSDGATRYLGTLIGQYNTVGAVDITGTTESITINLNGTTITPGNFGVNQ